MVGYKVHNIGINEIKILIPWTRNGRNRTIYFKNVKLSFDAGYDGPKPIWLKALIEIQRKGGPSSYETTHLSFSKHSGLKGEPTSLSNSDELEFYTSKAGGDQEKVQQKQPEMATKERSAQTNLDTNADPEINQGCEQSFKDMIEIKSSEEGNSDSPHCDRETIAENYDNLNNLFFNIIDSMTGIFNNLKGFNLCIKDLEIDLGEIFLRLEQFKITLLGDTGNKRKTTAEKIILKINNNALLLKKLNLRCDLDRKVAKLRGSIKEISGSIYFRDIEKILQKMVSQHKNQFERQNAYSDQNKADLVKDNRSHRCSCSQQGNDCNDKTCQPFSTKASTLKMIEKICNGQDSGFFCRKSRNNHYSKGGNHRGFSLNCKFKQIKLQFYDLEESFSINLSKGNLKATLSCKSLISELLDIKATNPCQSAENCSKKAQNAEDIGLKKFNVDSSSPTPKSCGHSLIFVTELSIMMKHDRPIKLFCTELLLDCPTEVKNLYYRINDLYNLVKAFEDFNFIDGLRGSCPNTNYMKAELMMNYISVGNFLYIHGGHLKAKYSPHSSFGSAVLQLDGVKNVAGTILEKCVMILKHNQKWRIRIPQLLAKCESFTDLNSLKSFFISLEKVISRCYLERQNWFPGILPEDSQAIEKDTSNLSCYGDRATQEQDRYSETTNPNILLNHPFHQSYSQLNIETLREYTIGNQEKNYNAEDGNNQMSYPNSGGTERLSMDLFANMNIMVENLLLTGINIGHLTNKYQNLIEDFSISAEKIKFKDFKTYPMALKMSGRNGELIGTCHIGRIDWSSMILDHLMCNLDLRMILHALENTETLSHGCHDINIPSSWNVSKTDEGRMCESEGSETHVECRSALDHQKTPFGNLLKILKGEIVLLSRFNSQKRTGQNLNEMGEPVTSDSGNTRITFSELIIARNQISLDSMNVYLGANPIAVINYLKDICNVTFGADDAKSQMNEEASNFINSTGAYTHLETSLETTQKFTIWKIILKFVQIHYEDCKIRMATTGHINRESISVHPFTLQVYTNQALLMDLFTDELVKKGCEVSANITLKNLPSDIGTIYNCMKRLLNSYNNQASEYYQSREDQPLHQKRNHAAYHFNVNHQELITSNEPIDSSKGPAYIHSNTSTRPDNATRHDWWDELISPLKICISFKIPLFGFQLFMIANDIKREYTGFSEVCSIYKGTILDFKCKIFDIHQLNIQNLSTTIRSQSESSYIDMDAGYVFCNLPLNDILGWVADIMELNSWKLLQRRQPKPDHPKQVIGTGQNEEVGGASQVNNIQYSISVKELRYSGLRTGQLILRGFHTDGYHTRFDIDGSIFARATFESAGYNNSGDAKYGADSSVLDCAFNEVGHELSIMGRPNSTHRRIKSRYPPDSSINKIPLRRSKRMRYSDIGQSSSQHRTILTIYELKGNVEDLYGIYSEIQAAFSGFLMNGSEGSLHFIVMDTHLKWYNITFKMLFAHIRLDDIIKGQARVCCDLDRSSTDKRQAVLDPLGISILGSKNFLEISAKNIVQMALTSEIAMELYRNFKEVKSTTLMGDDLDLTAMAWPAFNSGNGDQSRDLEVRKPSAPGHPITGEFNPINVMPSAMIRSVRQNRTLLIKNHTNQPFTADINNKCNILQLSQMELDISSDLTQILFQNEQTKFLIRLDEPQHRSYLINGEIVWFVTTFSHNESSMRPLNTGYVRNLLRMAGNSSEEDLNRNNCEGQFSSASFNQSQIAQSVQTTSPRIRNSSTDKIDPLSSKIYLEIRYSYSFINHLDRTITFQYENENGTAFSLELASGKSKSVPLDLNLFDIYRKSLLDIGNGFYYSAQDFYGCLIVGNVLSTWETDCVSGECILSQTGANHLIKDNQCETSLKSVPKFCSTVIFLESLTIRNLTPWMVVLQKNELPNISLKDDGHGNSQSPRIFQSHKSIENACIKTYFDEAESNHSHTTPFEIEPWMSKIIPISLDWNTKMTVILAFHENTLWFAMLLPRLIVINNLHESVSINKKAYKPGFICESDINSIDMIDGAQLSKSIQLDKQQSWKITKKFKQSRSLKRFTMSYIGMTVSEYTKKFGDHSVIGILLNSEDPLDHSLTFKKLDSGIWRDLQGKEELIFMLEFNYCNIIHNISNTTIIIDEEYPLPPRSLMTFDPTAASLSLSICKTPTSLKQSNLDHSRSISKAKQLSKEFNTIHQTTNPDHRQTSVQNEPELYEIFEEEYSRTYSIDPLLKNREYFSVTCDTDTGCKSQCYSLEKFEQALTNYVEKNSKNTETAKKQSTKTPISASDPKFRLLLEYCSDPSVQTTLIFRNEEYSPVTISNDTDRPIFIVEHGERIEIKPHSMQGYATRHGQETLIIEYRDEESEDYKSLEAKSESCQLNSSIYRASNHDVDCSTLDIQLSRGSEEGTQTTRPKTESADLAPSLLNRTCIADQKDKAPIAFSDTSWTGSNVKDIDNDINHRFSIVSLKLNKLGYTAVRNLGCTIQQFNTTKLITMSTKQRSPATNTEEIRRNLIFKIPEAAISFMGTTGQEIISINIAKSDIGLGIISQTLDIRPLNEQRNIEKTQIFTSDQYDFDVTIGGLQIDNQSQKVDFPVILYPKNSNMRIGKTGLRNFFSLKFTFQNLFSSYLVSDFVVEIEDFCLNMEESILNQVLGSVRNCLMSNMDLKEVNREVRSYYNTFQPAGLTPEKTNDSCTPKGNPNQNFDVYRTEERESLLKYSKDEDLTPEKHLSQGHSKIIEKDKEIKSEASDSLCGLKHCQETFPQNNMSLGDAMHDIDRSQSTFKTCNTTDDASARCEQNWPNISSKSKVSDVLSTNLRPGSKDLIVMNTKISSFTVVVNYAKNSEKGLIYALAGIIINNLTDISFNIDEYCQTETQKNFLQTILEFYKSQIIKKLYKCITHLNFIGNPGRIADYIADEFRSSTNQITPNLSPTPPVQKKNKFLKSTKKLLKGTIFGVSSTINKLSQSVSSAAKLATFDQSYSKRNIHRYYANDKNLILPGLRKHYETNSELKSVITLENRKKWAGISEFLKRNSDKNCQKYNASECGTQNLSQQKQSKLIQQFEYADKDNECQHTRTMGVVMEETCEDRAQSRTTSIFVEDVHQNSVTSNSCPKKVSNKVPSANNIPKTHQTIKLHRDHRRSPLLFRTTDRLFHSIVSGLSGMVKEPANGATKGVGDFFLGLGRGVMGAVAKPIVGIADTIADLTEEVNKNVGNAVPGRIHYPRPPNMLYYEDGIVQGYYIFNTFITKNKNEKFVNATFGLRSPMKRDTHDYKKEIEACEKSGTEYYYDMQALINTSSKGDGVEKVFHLPNSTLSYSNYGENKGLENICRSDNGDRGTCSPSSGKVVKDIPFSKLSTVIWDTDRELVQIILTDQRVLLSTHTAIFEVDLSNISLFERCFIFGNSLIEVQSLNFLLDLFKYTHSIETVILEEMK